jgi:predicted MFS family arabinose efflux permease
MLYRPNFATVIGPVLGGALAQRPGWRWIFWVLTMASGLCLLLIALFLPETSRHIVGNGSQKVSGLHGTVISYFIPSESVHVQSESTCAEKGELHEEPIRKPFQIPNPLASLKILWTKDTALITLIYGIYYMNFICLQASMSTLFIKIYKFSELKAGLVYLPFGIGSCLGAYCSGKPYFSFRFSLFPHYCQMS